MDNPTDVIRCFVLYETRQIVFKDLDTTSNISFIAFTSLSLLLPTVSYSPFPNLLYRGILFIGLTKLGFNSKFATPKAVSTSRLKTKLAERCSIFSVASIYSCVVSFQYGLSGKLQSSMYFSYSLGGTSGKS